MKEACNRGIYMFDKTKKKRFTLNFMCTKTLSIWFLFECYFPELNVRNMKGEDMMKETNHV